MNIEPFGNKRERRQEILRAVYEANLRMTEQPVPAPLPVRPPGPRRQRTVALLSVVAVVLIGFAYQGFSADGAENAGRPAPQAGPAAGLAPVVPVTSDRPEEDVPLVPERAPDASSYRDLLANAEMPLTDLFDLHVRTIVIDPGHGGKDPGTIGAGGAFEKGITLDVARKLKERLERRYGYEVHLTREWDVEVSLKERVAFANAQQADLFVSIHVNSLPVERVNVVETYYFGAQSDKAALQLAERENRDSEYSVAEFNTMLQAIGRSMKLQESKRMARSIQTSLYRNMRKQGEDVTNWGVKTAPFMVLLGVDAPSVLTEIGCISNPAQEAKLGVEGYRESLAAFIEEGVVNYLGQGPNKNELTEGATEHATEKD